MSAKTKKHGGPLPRSYGENRLWKEDPGTSYETKPVTKRQMRREDYAYFEYITQKNKKINRGTRK